MNFLTKASLKQALTRNKKKKKKERKENSIFNGPRKMKKAKMKKQHSRRHVNRKQNFFTN